LRAIIGGMADDLFKAGIEGNRVKRHLNIHGRGKLRAHTAHTLACRTFALGTLAFDHQHVFAACMREMPRDAGANNAAADDDYVCCLHVTCALEHPIAAGGLAPGRMPCLRLAIAEK
jgi:hypothetical protein